MSFLREYTAIDAGDPAATSAARVALTRQWMRDRPQALFAELRQEQPIFATPAFVLVTRHAEVHQVLTRDDVFSVQPYAARIRPLLGGFLLGNDDGVAYERDAAVLRLTVRRGDLPDIAAAAEQAAGIAIAGAREGDRIDAITGVARPLVADFIGRYLGVPGPTPEVLLRWARELARAAFCNDEDDPDVVDKAREAAAELGGYIDVMFASRRTQIAVGNPAGQDAVGRMLALQSAESARLDDRRLRDMLVGVIASACAPTIAAIVHVIDELARRPGIQARAIAALAADDDTDGLTAIVDEALRFAPPLWTPIRECIVPFTMARGTANETVLRPGTRVLASTYSAGFDPAEVPDPEHFRPGRPGLRTLGFGGGVHFCLGRHIAPVLVRAAVAALLRVGPVRPTPAGIVRDGPFPVGLPLEFVV